MFEQILKNKGISLERLMLLCKISHSGGIKAAVGDDPARQSLASRQIKELSDCVGLELCRRSGRTLEMTERGQALVDISTDFFRQLELFLSNARGLPQKFNLGVGDAIFQWQILPVMSNFHKIHSTSHIIPHSYNSTEIVKRTESGELDAGIVRLTAITSDSRLHSETLGETSYRLFIPTRLIASTGSQPLPLQINRIPFCSLTGNGTYTQVLNQFLKTYNGRVSLFCSSMIQMHAAVLSGQFAAVLPESAEIGFPDGSTTILTLPELTTFTRQLALICREETLSDPERRQIIVALTDAFKKDTSL